MKNECSNPNCGISTWLGNPISLELDHINGINTDYRIENLRILCPNCHSQTPTYCKKKSSLEPKKKLQSTQPNQSTEKENKCIDCNANVSAKSMRCKDCHNKTKLKISWPPIDILIDMVTKSSYLSVAKELGVSDNAIRKHIKANSDKNPPKKHK